jgi:class 3 adenylate cyclase
MSVETRHVRYIFADIERFTEDRTVEAQVQIVAALNESFLAAIGPLETIYLPTGDGICAGIIEANAAADIHLQSALAILDRFAAWSSNAIFNRQAKVRIAINESVDAVISDINGKRNLAGVGINSAQRLMSIADGNQIIAGQAAYDTLRVRDQYVSSFREVKAEIKHSRVITAYQFTGLKRSFLNIDIPFAVQRSNPIELQMIEAMEKPGGYSTAGMVRATYEANERWTAEMEHSLHRLRDRCTDKQRAVLESAQTSWKAFYDSEGDFIAALRETVHGTMYRPIAAGIMKALVERRASTLRHYFEDWVGLSGINQDPEPRPSP